MVESLIHASCWVVFSCGAAVYYTVQGVLTFKSVDETLVCDHSEETAIQQYVHVVLFIMLYKTLSKVICTFTSVDKTLVCDHYEESY